MAQRPKRSAKYDPKAGSPLDSKQRALEEQQQLIQAQLDKCKRVIEEAPKIKADRAREQREEIIRRAAHTDKRQGFASALTDRRFSLEANVAAPAQQKRLRSERQQGRLMFFVLLLALAGAICYLYYTVTQG